ncbi:MAG: bifunctional 4-hydroxy-2-oxoglutarate aldolase/2-dehydro-3-deoxy-phosphogluconate aldolase [Flavobacteriales bacterium]
MTNQEVLDVLERAPIVPLYYHDDEQIACALMDACYTGGARAIEFTNRGEHALRVFTAMCKYRTAHYPDMVLGIGSIATTDQILDFINVGADFLVSPFISKTLADYARSKNIFWTGGCGTITEMQTAYSWGVPLLKLFPGNIYGPAMIKAAKAPCPWLKIMPTGGVKPEKENLDAWFGAGATCVGMGSQLFVKDANGDFDYKEITEKVKTSLSIALA